MKSIDLIGLIFGKLTVIKEGRHQNKFHWECKCECGNIKMVRPYNLINGISKSCGCYRRENSKKINTKHGLNDHIIYRLFQGMKRRCFNKNNKDYINYGARGITICKEWLNSVQVFYDWCMSNGYMEGLQIERKENDKGYSPDNCIFVTGVINNRNKRNNVYIEFNGKQYRPFELEAIYKIPAKNLRDRVLYRNWTIEKALTTPIATR